ncbi:MAG: tRNA (adenosine(37)-N6)-dimethylallyltransferase MiaA [Oscillospiraceae bacterium]|nr:tRNA (adenosine(37)-N6)-dimethylallyltransferase MiaA [Oscillospiraceae bacterium]
MNKGEIGTEKIFTVVVCGATASGKTALAVRLAESFNGEIIGADSMQVYKGMDIATAKPTVEELRGVKHHLIDFLEPHEPFSVADYVDLAREKIAEVAASGKLPIIAGGTGLYINSLIDNIEFPEIKADMTFRKEMQSLANEKGAAYLLEKLREIDPVTAEALHENNVKRVIRALEVFHVTGKTMSELKELSRLEPSPYEPLMLAIDFPREKLYERIDKRVNEMLNSGLLAEAESFFAAHRGEPRHADSLPSNVEKSHATSAQAIGYKELFPYFNEEADLSECIANLKQSTKNYAKRQLTWFKKDKRIHFLKVENTEEAGENEFFEKIFKKAEILLKKYGNLI